MGYTDISKNDVVALQVRELLSRLKRPAKEKAIECTLLLAASSLLLGQTSDRARDDLRIGDLNGEAMDLPTARSLAEKLEVHLRRAAIAWVGRWSERGFPRLDGERPAFGDWRYVKRFPNQTKPDTDQFEDAMRRLGEPLGEDFPKYRLLRMIRNAIAHGGVQWTTKDQANSVSQQSPITGVLFSSHSNPQKCETCKQFLPDREARAKGVVEYDLVDAPITGFRAFIDDWARTLAHAGTSHTDLEAAIEGTGLIASPGAA
jgi:hypothetical protein